MAARPCATCGKATRRNGRGELLHVDYMETANDHAAVLADPHDSQPEDPDYREDYPVGEMIDCYSCKPVVGVKRRCVALGPIVNRADPTQSYRLDCGHLAI